MRMRVASITCLLFALSNAWALQQSDNLPSEGPSGLHLKPAVEARDYMVSAANPLAVNAGVSMLSQGGSAVDAMIATQLVLGLVEPQSSGLGGGAFALFYEAKSQQLISIDGRETAPALIDENQFLHADGSRMAFMDAVVGGRSVGTPGLVALMAQLHDDYGKLPWSSLFEPAIELAEEGFIVSPRLALLVQQQQESLSRFETTATYFLPQGKPIEAGARLINKDYAASLRLIAKHGARGFYHSQLAIQMVQAVKQAKPSGSLSLRDLSQYQAKLRPALCQPYRNIKICGMGPPSSGGFTVAQILALIENTPIRKWGPNNVQSWRLLGDASRLAYADRGHYLADSDFVEVPIQRLLSKDYIRKRAQLLKGQAILSEAPPGEINLSRSTHASPELDSTTHISIVDAKGNVLSMTSSIENAFGSRLMAGGFLLNNQLTDFSFTKQRNEVLVANRIEANKRPRSSMAPTIVFNEDEQPILAIGSPGGSYIITYVVNALVAHFDWNIPLNQAIARPHMLNRFGTFELETHPDNQQWHAPLQALGFDTTSKALTSGLQGIRIYPDKLIGVSDPRREGSSKGL